jgi:alpha-L-rhamnosidase
LRYGESYDATKEILDWCLPSFDDSGWCAVIAAENPLGEYRICEAGPIVATKELKAVKIWKEDDAYIYDFGENCAGVTRLCINGKKQQKVTVLHGEMLEDGRFSQKNILFPQHTKKFPDYDLSYTQRIVYTCKGEGKEIYQPKFTYFGFQYARVEGITEEQATPDLLTYVVMNSKLEERGSFECSCEILNKLQDMTRRSTLANFYHFPTDCPHREKNGWTADAALSSEHTLLNLNPEIYYREWIRNVAKAMKEDGSLPGIVPTTGWGFAWGNGPAWDTV